LAATGGDYFPSVPFVLVAAAVLGLALRGSVSEGVLLAAAVIGATVLVPVVKSDSNGRHSESIRRTHTFRAATRLDR
jgi:hypothetical protein